MSNSFEKIIKEQGIIILDGALATELEARGANLNHSLWSAKLLKEDPDLIKQVQLDYLEVGANVITTATYQASFEGFEKQGYTRKATIDLMEMSVLIAEAARKEFLLSNGKGIKRIILVAASIGPYGASLADGSEYHGNYGVTLDDLINFHADRLAVLANTNADILAFETIPCLDEAKAIKKLLTLYPNKKAWVSFSCQDGQRLSSGEFFADAVRLLDDSNEVIGIGVNCTAPIYVESLVQIAKSITDKIIMAYPNKGESYDPISKSWETRLNDDNHFINDAKKWFAAGALAIGGCCRTNPKDIKQLAALKKTN